MASNNLNLNINKTQLLRTTSRQQHVGNRDEKIILEAKDEHNKNIIPSQNAKILGLIFSKSLNWRDFLEVGKNAMVLILKKKLGALKITSKYASFKVKLKLLHGIVYEYHYLWYSNLGNSL